MFRRVSAQRHQAGGGRNVKVRGLRLVPTYVAIKAPLSVIREREIVLNGHKLINDIRTNSWSIHHTFN